MAYSFAVIAVPIAAVVAIVTCAIARMAAAKSANVSAAVVSAAIWIVVVVKRTDVVKPVVVSVMGIR